MSEGSDFYEDDEPVEKIRAAFERGEKGFTAPRDLNQRARSIVDRAVERSEAQHGVPLQVVSSGTAATTEVIPAERIPAADGEPENLKTVAYQVG
ncbi:MAG: hypothetical protein LC808_36095 [Actinobacteria bacterium]|nr:hypothetical protein [Actinomycetota bacterium]